MLRILIVILAIVALLAQLALTGVTIFSSLICWGGCPLHSGVREPFALLFASLWWLFLPTLVTTAVSLSASIHWRHWQVTRMMSALVVVFGTVLLALWLTIPFGPVLGVSMTDDPWIVCAMGFIVGLVVFPIVALWRAKPTTAAAQPLIQLKNGDEGR